MTALRWKAALILPLTSAGATTAVVVLRVNQGNRHRVMGIIVDAMKVGAFDYVLKPFRLQTMLPVLTRAMNTRHLRLENVQLREAVAVRGDRHLLDPERCADVAGDVDDLRGLRGAPAGVEPAREMEGQCCG